MAKKRQINPKELPAWQRGLERARNHHLYGELLSHIYFQKKDDIKLINIVDKGYIYFNSSKNFSPNEWAALFQIAALHLFLNLVTSKSVNKHYEIAALNEVVNFWLEVGGDEFDLPSFLKLNEEKYPYAKLSLTQLEEKLYIEGIPQAIDSYSLNLSDAHGALVFTPKDTKKIDLDYNKPKDFPQIFAQALKENLRKTFDLMGRKSDHHASAHIAEAKNWLLKYFPLVGVLVNRFDTIEDSDICEKMKIRWAAVNGTQKEFYINPKVFDNDSEYAKKVENAIWLLAHLSLHIVMQHRSRGVGRDRWYWNLAAEIVIEGWLKKMQVGVRPHKILGFDSDIDNGVTDDIYEAIVREPKMAKKWETLKGEHPDILDDDEFIYGAAHDEQQLLALLKRGYDLQLGRGEMPGAMQEEIRVILQPPIAWEVELAHWMGTYLPSQESIRSYAHPSRRQESTPDIPRARLHRPLQDEVNLTFAVIVDTSGSMLRSLLGKVLGTVASYAQERGVEEVRLVYCDAQAYDAGYVAVTDMLEHLSVRGRGGTVLQRAVDLLESAKDFPKEAPILILTDGFIDDLSIHHNHAFVLPQGTRLPFVTDKKIFYIK